MNFKLHPATDCAMSPSFPARRLPKFQQISRATACAKKGVIGRILENGSNVGVQGRPANSQLPSSPGAQRLSEDYHGGKRALTPTWQLQTPCIHHASCDTLCCMPHPFSWHVRVQYN